MPRVRIDDWFFVLRPDGLIEARDEFGRRFSGYFVSYRSDEPRPMRFQAALDRARAAFADMGDSI